MVFRAIRSDGRILVAVSRSPGRISVADYTGSTLYQDVDLEENCEHIFDVTGDGRHLAVGYDYFRGVDVWDLATGERSSQFGPGDVNSVRFDATGRFLCVTKEGITRIYRWRDREIVETVKYCHNVQRGAALNPNTNTMLIPTQQRGRMYHVRFNPLAVDTIELPSSKKSLKACWSPDYRRLVVMGDDIWVRCFSEVGGDPLWAILLDEDQCSGACGFSADGTLLGVWIEGPRGERRATVVLDAATGRLLHTIPRYYGEYSPFEGTTVMTSGGVILDLADGSADITVSRAAYWRSIGLQF